MRIVALLILVILMLATGVAETTSHTSRHKLEKIVDVDNPDQYFYGHVVSGDWFKVEDSVYTAVQVHPHLQSDMYDSQITFCDDVRDQFSEIKSTDLVVITYSIRFEPKMCHDLIRVDVVGSDPN